MAVVLLAAIGLALAGATMLGTVVADASPALIGSAEALARSGADGRLGLDIPCPLHHASSMVAAEVGFIAGLPAELTTAEAAAGRPHAADPYRAPGAGSIDEL